MKLLSKYYEAVSNKKKKKNIENYWTKNGQLVKKDKSNMEKRGAGLKPEQDVRFVDKTSEMYYMILEPQACI